jgi:PilZ domain
MQDRRVQPRMLCADLVDLHWRDKGGRTRRMIANLEDISLSGACLQVEGPLPLQTEVRISYPKGELLGRVRYCVFREIGYFLGVQFDPGCRWSLKRFKPQHMLDPRRLVTRVIERVQRPPAAN